MLNRKIAQKIQDTIEKHKMIGAGDIVICALSGGADSIVMVHALYNMGFDIRAAHFSHGIRKLEGARELELVQSFCNKLGVALFWEQGDTPKFALENKLGIEEAARILRYKFLQDCAKKCENQLNLDAVKQLTMQEDMPLHNAIVFNTGKKSSAHVYENIKNEAEQEAECLDAQSRVKIATAHHLQDNAETVLFNLARGAGAAGVCGIPPVRQNIIRPMLCVSRQEIEQLAQENNLEFATDETNFQPTYARNRIRLKVMPILAQINSNAAEKIMENCEILREDCALLDEMTQKFVKNSVKIEQKKAIFELKTLKKQPKPIANRAIKMAFAQICASNAPISFKNIAAINAICTSQNPSAKCDLAFGMQARREYGRLILQAADCAQHAKGIQSQDYAENTQNLAANAQIGDENAANLTVKLQVPTQKEQNLELGAPYDARMVQKKADVGLELAHEVPLFTQSLRITLGGQAECGDNVCWLRKCDVQPPFFVRARQIGDKIKIGEHHKSLKKLMIEKKIPVNMRDNIPIIFDAKGAVVICHDVFLSSKDAAIMRDSEEFHRIIIHKEDS